MGALGIIIIPFGPPGGIPPPILGGGPILFMLGPIPPGPIPPGPIGPPIPIFISPEGGLIPGPIAIGLGGKLFGVPGPPLILGLPFGPMLLGLIPGAGAIIAPGLSSNGLAA